MPALPSAVSTVSRFFVRAIEREAVVVRYRRTTNHTPGWWSPDWLRTRDVVRLSGITERQLQWWDEHHIVPVNQQGHLRIYTRPDAFRILLVAEMRRKQVPFRRIRGALRLIDREIGRGIIDEARRGEELFLVLLDRPYIQFRRGKEAVIAAAAAEPGGVCVFSLADIARRVEARR
jgi:DNA-binding transcriptional MerR regulator